MTREPGATPSEARIGLFGGTFSPPHVGHLAVAEAAREQLALDAVLWIPAAVSPFKAEAEQPDARHRLEMTRLATADHSAFQVDAREVERGGVSYTVDTVRAVAAQQPEATLYLLLGADSLAGFPRWREPEVILGHAQLAVYHRPGYAPSLDVLPAAWRDRVEAVEGPELAVSSTSVRALRAAGRSARYLIPEPVRAYLDEHRLFGEPQ